LAKYDKGLFISVWKNKDSSAHVANELGSYEIYERSVTLCRGSSPVVAFIEVIKNTFIDI